MIDNNDIDKCDSLLITKDRNSNHNYFLNDFLTKYFPEETENNNRIYNSKIFLDSCFSIHDCSFSIRIEKIPKDQITNLEALFGNRLLETINSKKKILYNISCLFIVNLYVKIENSLSETFKELNINIDDLTLYITNKNNKEIKIQLNVKFLEITIKKQGQTLNIK